MAEESKTNLDNVVSDLKTQNNILTNMSSNIKGLVNAIISQGRAAAEEAKTRRSEEKKGFLQRLEDAREAAKEKRQGSFGGQFMRGLVGDTALAGVDAAGAGLGKLFHGGTFALGFLTMLAGKLIKGGLLLALANYMGGSLVDYIMGDGEGLSPEAKKELDAKKDKMFDALKIGALLTPFLGLPIAIIAAVLSYYFPEGTEAGGEWILDKLGITETNIWNNISQENKDLIESGTGAIAGAIAIAILGKMALTAAGGFLWNLGAAMATAGFWKGLFAIGTLPYKALVVATGVISQGILGGIAAFNWAGSLVIGAVSSAITTGLAAGGAIATAVGAFTKTFVAAILGAMSGPLIIAALVAAVTGGTVLLFKKAINKQESALDMLYKEMPELEGIIDPTTLTKGIAPGMATYWADRLADPETRAQTLEDLEKWIADSKATGLFDPKNVGKRALGNEEIPNPNNGLEGQPDRLYPSQEQLIPLYPGVPDSEAQDELKKFLGPSISPISYQVTNNSVPGLTKAALMSEMQWDIARGSMMILPTVTGNNNVSQSYNTSSSNTYISGSNNDNYNTPFHSNNGVSA